MSLNIVTLLGRLTRDPEVRVLGEGDNKVVCSFNLAVDDGFGDKKKTYFFRCVAWGKTAENIGNNVVKGHRLVVQGKLMQQNYEDKEGNKRSSIDVKVNGFDYIEPKKRESVPDTMEGFQGEETEVEI